MYQQSQSAPGAATARLRPVDDRMLGRIGRLFGLATVAGLGVFGGYLALWASAASIQNFEQWQKLVTGPPMPTTSEWSANLGI